MRIIAAAVMCLACGPTYSIHTRTSPTRVDVTKQASAPELELIARHVGTDAVELAAKRARDVRVTRVVRYGAASMEATRGRLLLKLLEIPMGLFIPLLGPVSWETPVLMKDTRTTKLELHTNWILAMLNPFQSFSYVGIRLNPDANVEVFADPPVVREFHVSLPAPKLTIAFRAFDDREQPIASGTVVTDAFGRVMIPNLTTAIAIELTVAGTTTLVPIDPEVL